METTDAHLEEGAVEWTNYRGDVYIRLPCSNFADFLYKNRTLKDTVSPFFQMATTSSNAAKGAAAGCKGCALIHDAVTTFRQGRLPMDDISITFKSNNDMIHSSILKIVLYLHPVRKRAKREDAGSSKELILESYADENCVRKYLECLVLRLDWSKGK